MIEELVTRARANRITLFDLDDERQGIVHVFGPELGLSLPGMTIACGDSHTATHGAFGALGLGVGSSEVGHILATQTLWQAKPKTMRIRVSGRIQAPVAAKDIILAIIGKIGVAGATGHVVEYGGSAIEALTMEGRMTICNMSIEAGARAGLIAPDDVTIAYLRGRAYAPCDSDRDAAVRGWRTLRSDDDAVFDREHELDARDIGPMVTWGTAPSEVVRVDQQIPDLDAIESHRRDSARKGLDYMGLEPGLPMEGLAVDKVFIGSCTNGRIEDLRAAAAILRGRQASVPTIVVPGSTGVRKAAEAEGLDRIFREAGIDWRHAGCSMCLAINGDRGEAGERIASTTNRNFVGRQGPGVRTHLMSPAMAAAASITGRIVDVRAYAW